MGFLFSQKNLLHFLTKLWLFHVKRNGDLDMWRFTNFPSELKAEHNMFLDFHLKTQLNRNACYRKNSTLLGRGW